MKARTRIQRCAGSSSPTRSCAGKKLAVVARAALLTGTEALQVSSDPRGNQHYTLMVLLVLTGEGAGSKQPEQLALVGPGSGGSSDVVKEGGGVDCLA